jgi:prepilin-type processing-associated H-X9-DG protein
VKGRQSLLCLSFDPKVTASAMDAETCDGSGSPGSASAAILPADFYFSGYGLAYPLTLNPGCDKRGAKPYAKYPGSGWIKDYNGSYVYHLQTLSSVIDPARTAIVGDGLTYQSHNAKGPFFGTLFGCEGRGRHKGGATLSFLDGHAKWISEDPEHVLDEDKNGCLYERYYASDK